MSSMPDRLAALERRLSRLEANPAASLRFGSVTGVEGGFARVQLPDGQNMVSALIPTLQPRVLKDQDIKMPDIGEPVACLFAGQGLEAGVVMGACYSPVTPDPGQTPHMDYHRYEDGTELWYDREEHKLIAKVKGDVEAEITGNVQAEVEGNVTATVKGNAELETQGHIHAKSQKEIRAESATTITLKAPIIALNGLLRVTDKDGRPGSGDLLGNYRIRQGSLSVPDDNISTGQQLIAATDAVVNGISFVSHEHEGVMPGPGVSGVPVGGGGGQVATDPNNTVTHEEDFNALYETPPPYATNKDRLLLCLPRIAAAEAMSSWFEHDQTGWLQLRAMFHKWFTGDENRDAESSSDVFWIEMSWVLSYRRVAIAYDYMIRDEYLFHPNAQQELAKILFDDDKLCEYPTTFDYTNPKIHSEEDRPWREWKDYYFQRYDLENIYLLPIDGLSSSVGNASFRALAAGKTVPLGNGGHRIIVERVSIYVWDSFNFHGEDGLGYWSCEKEKMHLSNIGDDPAFSFVTNEDFEKFRLIHGRGKDFMVLSRPRNIAYLPRFEYETKL